VPGSRPHVHEEELVSFSGARLAQDEKSILRVFTEGYQVPGAGEEHRAAGFGDPIAARSCLEELVSHRLLSPLGGSENPSYELIHDLLAGVVEKSRTARQERLKKEEAARLAEAERKAKEDAEASAREATRRNAILNAALQKETLARKEADLATRRAYWLAIGAVVVALIAAASLAAALGGLSAAQAAKEQATASKELIRFMQYDLCGTLGKLGHLDMMWAINARIVKYYEAHAPEAGDVAALRDALEEQGNLFLAQGDQARALKSYRDGLAIMEKLAKQNPFNADWQDDLSLSIGYEKVGDVQMAEGDLGSALKSYRDSLAIREKLAKQYARQPFTDRLQDSLSIGYGKVGDVQMAEGDLGSALKSYRDGLAIMEKLAKQDPSNAGWQHGLAASYEEVGDVLSAQGDLAGALKNYRDVLAIMEKLAKQDPSNAGWQHDVSDGYNDVGDVLSAQGDLVGALKSYRDGLAIREKLAKQDSSNGEWQADLAYSYWQTGTTLARSDPQSQEEARSMIEKGRDILRQLKERIGLGSVVRIGLGFRQQRWLDSIEADLRKMQEQK
jgi:tetratricopeptide (TPR) repeat protein